MSRNPIKYAISFALLMIQMQAMANGMLDIDAYLKTGIAYDDNIFRQPSNTPATNTSDVIKTLGAGASANLQLSRQLIRLSASVSKNTYDENTFLNNDTHSLGLNWSWRIGSHFYGELSSSKSDAISGFDNNTARVKNLQTYEIKRATINWRLMPDWTIYGLKEYSDTKNDNVLYEQFNREDDATELGLRFANTLGTQFGVFYRNVDSDYNGRSAFQKFIFGSQSIQKQYGIDFSWLPTDKIRLNGRVSKTTFDRIDASQANFSGTNQRLNLNYLLTAKTNIGITVYKEASQVDTITASFVETNGGNINAIWNATSKTGLSVGAGVLQRDFLSIGSGPSVINDQTTSVNASLMYRPTDQSLIQLQYSYQNRESSDAFSEYQFNHINLTGEYFF